MDNYCWIASVVFVFQISATVSRPLVGVAPTTTTTSGFLACHLPLDPWNQDVVEIPPFNIETIDFSPCSEVILSTVHAIFDDLSPVSSAASAKTDSLNLGKFTVLVMKFPKTKFTLSIRAGAGSNIYDLRALLRSSEIIDRLISFLTGKYVTKFDVAWAIIERTTNFSVFLKDLRTRLSMARIRLSTTISNEALTTSNETILAVATQVDSIFVAPGLNPYYRVPSLKGLPELGDRGPVFDSAELSIGSFISQYVLLRLPKQKLLVGQSLDSILWRTGDAMITDASSISRQKAILELMAYKDSCDLVRTGWRNLSSSKTPFARPALAPCRTQWVYGVDPSTLAGKASLLLLHGFSGLAIYDFHKDDHDGQCADSQNKPLALSRMVRSIVDNTETPVKFDQLSGISSNSSHLCAPFLNLTSGCDGAFGFTRPPTMASATQVTTTLETIATNLTTTNTPVTTQPTTATTTTVAAPTNRTTFSNSVSTTEAVTNTTLLAILPITTTTGITTDPTTTVIARTDHATPSNSTNSTGVTTNSTPYNTLLTTQPITTAPNSTTTAMTTIPTDPTTTVIASTYRTTLSNMTNSTDAIIHSALLATQPITTTTGVTTDTTTTVIARTDRTALSNSTNSTDAITNSTLLATQPITTAPTFATAAMTTTPTDPTTTVIASTDRTTTSNSISPTDPTTTLVTAQPNTTSPTTPTDPTNPTDPTTTSTLVTAQPNTTTPTTSPDPTIPIDPTSFETLVTTQSNTTIPTIPTDPTTSGTPVTTQPNVTSPTTPTDPTIPTDPTTAGTLVTTRLVATTAFTKTKTNTEPFTPTDFNTSSALVAIQPTTPTPTFSILATNKTSPTTPATSANTITSTTTYTTISVTEVLYQSGQNTTANSLESELTRNYPQLETDNQTQMLTVPSDLSLPVTLNASSNQIKMSSLTSSASNAEPVTFSTNDLTRLLKANTKTTTTEIKSVAPVNNDNHHNTSAKGHSAPKQPIVIATVSSTLGVTENTTELGTLRADIANRAIIADDSVVLTTKLAAFDTTNHGNSTVDVFGTRKVTNFSSNTLITTAGINGSLAIDAQTNTSSSTPTSFMHSTTSTPLPQVPNISNGTRNQNKDVSQLVFVTPLMDSGDSSVNNIKLIELNNYTDTLKPLVENEFSEAAGTIASIRKVAEVVHLTTEHVIAETAKTITNAQNTERIHPYSSGASTFLTELPDVRTTQQKLPSSSGVTWLHSIPEGRSVPDTTAATVTIKLHPGTNFGIAGPTEDWLKNDSDTLLQGDKENLSRQPVLTEGNGKASLNSTTVVSRDLLMTLLTTTTHKIIPDALTTAQATITKSVTEEERIAVFLQNQTVAMKEAVTSDSKSTVFKNVFAKEQEEFMPVSCTNQQVPFTQLLDQSRDFSLTSTTSRPIGTSTSTRIQLPQIADKLIKSPLVNQTSSSTIPTIENATARPELVSLSLQSADSMYINVLAAHYDLRQTKTQQTNYLAARAVNNSENSRANGGAALLGLNVKESLDSYPATMPTSSSTEAADSSNSSSNSSAMTRNPPLQDNPQNVSSKYVIQDNTVYTTVRPISWTNISTELDRSMDKLNDNSLAHANVQASHPGTVSTTTISTLSVHAVKSESLSEDPNIEFFPVDRLPVQMQPPTLKVNEPLAPRSKDQVLGTTVPTQIPNAIQAQGKMSQCSSCAELPLVLIPMNSLHLPETCTEPECLNDAVSTETPECDILETSSYSSRSSSLSTDSSSPVTEMSDPDSGHHCVNTYQDNSSTAQTTDESTVECQHSTENPSLFSDDTSCFHTNPTLSTETTGCDLTPTTVDTGYPSSDGTTCYSTDYEGPNPDADQISTSASNLDHQCSDTGATTKCTEDLTSFCFHTEATASTESTGCETTVPTDAAQLPNEGYTDPTCVSSTSPDTTIGDTTDATTALPDCNQAQNIVNKAPFIENTGNNNIIIQVNIKHPNNQSTNTVKRFWTRLLELVFPRGHKGRYKTVHELLEELLYEIDEHTNKLKCDLSRTLNCRHGLWHQLFPFTCSCVKKAEYQDRSFRDKVETLLSAMLPKLAQEPVTAADLDDIQYFSMVLSQALRQAQEDFHNVDIVDIVLQVTQWYLHQYELRSFITTALKEKVHASNADFTTQSSERFDSSTASYPMGSSTTASASTVESSAATTFTQEPLSSSSNDYARDYMSTDAARTELLQLSSELPGSTESSAVSSDFATSISGFSSSTTYEPSSSHGTCSTNCEQNSPTTRTELVTAVSQPDTQQTANKPFFSALSSPTSNQDFSYTPVGLSDDVPSTYSSSVQDETWTTQVNRDINTVFLDHSIAAGSLVYRTSEGTEQTLAGFTVLHESTTSDVDVFETKNAISSSAMSLVSLTTDDVKQFETSSTELVLKVSAYPSPLAQLTTNDPVDDTAEQEQNYWTALNSSAMTGFSEAVPTVSSTTSPELFHSTVGQASSGFPEQVSTGYIADSDVWTGVTKSDTESSPTQLEVSSQLETTPPTRPCKPIGEKVTLYKWPKFTIRREPMKRVTYPKIDAFYTLPALPDIDIPQPSRLPILPSCLREH